MTAIVGSIRETAQPPVAARPGPSARGHTRIRLTQRGRTLMLLAGLATGAAWMSGEENARIAAALLIAPILLDFALKPRGLHRIRASVAPRRTTAGNPFFEDLDLQGASSCREVTVHEPRTSSIGAWAMVERMRPDRRVAIRFRARSNLRSHLLDRVFVLRSDWPFGFFSAHAVLRCQAELVTEPARVRLPADLLQSVQHPARADRDRIVSDGMEFHSLREHRTEEDARGVHPLRSAALGCLVRRVTQGSIPREVGIVLDLRRPPGRQLNLGQRRFEWSLSACATLLDRLQSIGSKTRVLVFGSKTAKTTVETSADLVGFLTFLSEADPSAHRPLDERALDALASCDQCYWIGAGGHVDRGELRLLSGGAVLLTEDIQ